MLYSHSFFKYRKAMSTINTWMRSNLKSLHNSEIVQPSNTNHQPLDIPKTNFKRTVEDSPFLLYHSKRHLNPYPTLRCIVVPIVVLQDPKHLSHQILEQGAHWAGRHSLLSRNNRLVTVQSIDATGLCINRFM